MNALLTSRAGEGSLRAEPEPANGIGIDRKKVGVWSHRGAKAPRGAAVPHADFGQSAPASRIPGQALALRDRRLALRRGEAQTPEDEMEKDPHGVRVLRGSDGYRTTGMSTRDGNSGVR